jgi:hypothetical protein
MSLPSSPNHFFSLNHSRQSLMKSGAAKPVPGMTAERSAVYGQVERLLSQGIEPRQIRDELNAMGLLNGQGLRFTTEQVLRVVKRIRKADKL